MTKLTLASVFIICISMLFPACREDSRISNPDHGSGIEWPDRTSREGCVKMLEMALSHHGAEQYRELLLEPDSTSEFPEGYVWLNNQGETDSDLPDSLDYAGDVEAVENLIAHILEMDIRIFDSNWYSLDYLRGRNCSDCWETLRSYMISARLDNGEVYVGEFRLMITVGPDPEDTERYVIYEAVDLPKAGKDVGKLPADVEGTSLGELKNIFR